MNFKDCRWHRVTEDPETDNWYLTIVIDKYGIKRTADSYWDGESWVTEEIKEAKVRFWSEYPDPSQEDLDEEAWEEFSKGNITDSILKDLFISGRMSQRREAK